MSGPIAYSLAGAAEAIGKSPSYVERAIKAGTLRAKKSGVGADGEPVGSWVIPAKSLEAFIDGLVDA
jgi:hypothetical protein